jgi:hypothetical protein
VPWSTTSDPLLMLDALPQGEGRPRPPALLPLAAFTNLRWNPCGYVYGPVA